MRSTYSDGGQQPFRHVCHNDANEEDDSLQPGVTQDDGQDEKCDTQEDSHTSDNVDEVLDLLSNGGFASLQARGQSSNATHDCAVSGADNNATRCAWFGRSTEIQCCKIYIYISIASVSVYCTYVYLGYNYL